MPVLKGKGFVYQATIAEKILLDPQTALLTLDAPAVARTASPGQFVQLSTSRFLRRPISILSADRARGTVELGIRAAGTGTEELIGMAAGTAVSVIGPLGRGFSLENTGELIAVGGGIGLFPVIFALEDAKRLSIKTTLIAGFRSEAQTLLPERLRNLADRSVFSSDAGGLDFHGNAAEALSSELSASAESPGGNSGRAKIITCGPVPLLRAVAAIAAGRGIPCDVSLESRMACGIGVCLGCAVPVLDRAGEIAYERCCYEGPVFDASRVAWRNMAGLV